MNILVNHKFIHSCESQCLFGLVSSRTNSSYPPQPQLTKSIEFYRRLRRFCVNLFIWWPVTGLALSCALVNFADAQTLAEDRSALVRMLNDAERALSARNAARFLSYFDARNNPDYFRVETHIVALTRQSYIASSIGTSDWVSNDNGYSGIIDWMVQLTLVSSPGKIETRRTNVQVSVVRSKKNKTLWKIKTISPIDFFRPL